LPLRVRRVVTGHDSGGQSVTAIDEIVPTVTSARAGHQDALIWTSGTTPADNRDAADGALRKGPGSTVFRVARYNPGVAPRNHRTQTMDYAIVLAGQIEMQLDRGSVTLAQGDVLVQRGTMHNWVNHGPDPCVIAFVLIEALADASAAEAAQHKAAATPVLSSSASDYSGPGSELEATLPASAASSAETIAGASTGDR
jgi:quercetin dioxygenase-like cupin family protein